MPDEAEAVVVSLHAAREKDEEHMERLCDARAALVSLHPDDLRVVITVARALHFRRSCGLVEKDST